MGNIHRTCNFWYGILSFTPIYWWNIRHNKHDDYGTNYSAKLINKLYFYGSIYRWVHTPVSINDPLGILFNFLVTVTSDNQQHDDVTKSKHFPRCLPLVRGIHRRPLNSPHKGQWRGVVMFSLIYVWTNGRVNNRDATVMKAGMRESCTRWLSNHDHDDQYFRNDYANVRFTSNSLSWCL